jgi:chemotaxis response regulator CheB
MNHEPSQGPQTSAQAEAARPQRGSHPRCVIVGIGASAGGLAAFETFFTQMPPDSILRSAIATRLELESLVAGQVADVVQTGKP